MNDHFAEARRIVAGWPEWKRNIGHRLDPMPQERTMITLTTPVRELKGVGPSKAAALKRLGIKAVEDLLHHYPSGYTFAPPLGGPLTDGQPATVVGDVVRVSAFNRNFEAVLDTGVRIMWFGGQYLRESVFKGSRLMVSGIVTHGGFTNPAWKVLKPDETPDPSALNEVTYPVTSGITSKDIGRLIKQLLDAKFSFPTATLAIHLPLDQDDVEWSRRHLKHDELYYMQLALAVRQARREQEPPSVKCIGPMGSVSQYFPFKFTPDQAKATVEVVEDLSSPRAMNRLLQGDVGCGKTAVAAYAAIVMAFNGGQTAILCPTEILARQHYETIKGYFERAGVSHSLVLGGRGGKYDSRTSNITIGTTALLSDGQAFSRLGLVIIDEQHRFGVEQRAALRRHGNPHVLVMTATPIPRTMAMTVFGDLDVSTIRSMPPGRRPVKTWWKKSRDEVVWRFTGVGPANGYPDLHVYDVIERELAAGHQVYVVCPRIEALDDEMRAVEEVLLEYARLFPDAAVLGLTGRTTSIGKQQVAEWWSAPASTGKILVSTTVVEVGVDNPNATVMVIEGAERFGLAQLHQLRGRVGRGPDQSYCFLLSDTDSAEARARLRVMEQTNDGFEIAEADLRQRGPGDLLSTRQHGLPELRIADLVEDYDLLVEARKEARELVAKGPLPESVRAELERRFGSNLLLGDAA
jgi:ATP-dependent DNA helicase RecG